MNEKAEETIPKNIDYEITRVGEGVERHRRWLKWTRENVDPKLQDEIIAGRMHRLEDEGETDPLTGLLNRRGVEVRTQGVVLEALRSGKALGLVVLDINSLKRYNLPGHYVGDRVLQGVARSLKETVRGRDILGRWGGDEFVIFVVPEGGEELTEEKLEGFNQRLKEAVEKIPREEIIKDLSPEAVEKLPASVGFTSSVGVLEIPKRLTFKQLREMGYEERMGVAEETAWGLFYKVDQKVMEQKRQREGLRQDS